MVEYRHVIHRYPAVVNDSQKFKIAEAAARLTVGDQWDGDIKPVTPSEDFSFYLERVPGVFAFIGNGDSAPCTRRSMILMTILFP